MVDNTDFPQDGSPYEEYRACPLPSWIPQILGLKALFLGITDSISQMLLDFAILRKKGRKGKYGMSELEIEDSMKQKKPQIYTVTMAQLLMDWRTSQGISRYEVAKSTGMHINTVKRLEEGEGGITFEDGLRYLLYADSHKSKPNLMKKFRDAMASYQTEQEQADVVNAQQKQRRTEAMLKDFERRRIENTTRHAV